MKITLKIIMIIKTKYSFCFWGCWRRVEEFIEERRWCGSFGSISDGERFLEMIWGVWEGREAPMRGREGFLLWSMDTNVGHIYDSWIQGHDKV